jgi:hypothetical protein
LVGLHVVSYNGPSLPQFMQESEKGLYCHNDKALRQSWLAESMELQKFAQTKERGLFWTTAHTQEREESQLFLNYNEFAFSYIELIVFYCML